MGGPVLTPQNVQDNILASLSEQLRDLQPTLTNLSQIAGLVADLNHLATLVATGSPQQLAVNQVVTSVQAIQSDQTATMPAFGPVLESLYTLQAQLQIWVTQQQPPLTEGDQSTILALVASTITQVRQLLDYRPDVGAVMDDLAAVKTLEGGPADATAFHDFYVLQLALPDVWAHLFDNEIKGAATELYNQANQLYAGAGVVMPDPGEIADLDQLNEFISGVASVTGVVVPQTSSASIQVGNVFNFGSSTPTANGVSSAAVPPPPTTVTSHFPDAVQVWGLLSDAQRASLISLGQTFDGYANDPGPNYFSLAQELINEADAIIAGPEGTGGRLAQLITELAQAQSEPYAFDVFAPNSFNFGLVITYRQIWQPGPYQAGNLVSTIPLAPGETRKYTHRKVVKKTVSQKTAEKSTEARSQQSTDDSRAEQDIMDRASSATNFQITTKGSFNIGIGSMDVTSVFGGNTSAESTQNKKNFHEATLKAAEEYRLERSTEVDVTASTETEDTTSGEISNPNNEITVTYLFYELQRRYTIREFLYRVQPVIMIAQDVPSPEEINETWLLQYQWILSRVLLDDSLRPALNYLSTGYAGDQVSVAVLEAQWKTQEALVQQLEALVQQQLNTRDSLRNYLVQTQETEDSLPEMPGVLNVFTWGYDPSDNLRKQLKAQINAGETRLKYAEQALADAQDKLNNATSAYRQATKDYAVALQKQFARQVAIDQLRLNVKQNIFYYMQAIWAHEPADQRFFRLYRQQVLCPSTPTHCSMPITTSAAYPIARISGTIPVSLQNVCIPGLNANGELGAETVDLASIADIDNPLGYKGNYLLFPLKTTCPITQYMLSEYIDENYGVNDPDGSDQFDAEQFDDQWQAALAAGDQATLQQLQTYLQAHIEEINNESDEIIVPTGQLFIEALPGSHPLLEDFKLLHRAEDIKRVQADNRAAELENLRFASRLIANPPVLQDPHIDKRIVVDKGVGVVVDSNP
jgi:hypothetical protein